MKVIGLLVALIIVLLMINMALYTEYVECKSFKMTTKGARRFLENTKVSVTPEQSAKIQEFAFKVGFSWWAHTTTVMFTNKGNHFLYFSREGHIMFGYSHDFFIRKTEFTEISAEDIFRIKIIDNE